MLSETGTSVTKPPSACTPSPMIKHSPTCTRQVIATSSTSPKISILRRPTTDSIAKAARGSLTPLLTTTNPTSVAAGDIHDCLTNIELDKYLSHLKPYIPADRIYHARTSPDDRLALQLAADIECTVRKHGYAIYAVHVRHHWTTAISFLRNDSIHTNIYDSAKAVMTARDMKKIYSRMKMNLPTILAHAKQRRGSNECGLHVILIALWKTWSGNSLPTTNRRRAPEVSLAKWRNMLHQLQLTGRSHIDEDTALQLFRAADGLLENDLLTLHGDLTSPALTNYSSSPALPAPAPRIAGGQRATLKDAPRAATTAVPPYLGLITMDRPHNDNLPLTPPPTAAPTREIIDVDNDEDDIAPPPAPANDSHLDAVINTPISIHVLLDASDVHRPKWSEGTENRLQLLLCDRSDELEGKTTVTAPTLCSIRQMPKELHDDPTFFRYAYRIAEQELRRNSTAETLTDNHRITSCYPLGRMLTDTLLSKVITGLVQSLPNSSPWTILHPAPIKTFNHTGRKTSLPDVLSPKVAAIICYHKHFILVTSEGAGIAVYDSLIGPSIGGNWKPDPYQLKIINRFATLLSERGHQPGTTVTYMPCKLQACNDCGIEAINNLVKATTGQYGCFSRDMIRTAFNFYSTNPGCEFNFNVVPSNPSIIKVETNDTTSDCCKREKVAGHWCAWHHPTIVSIKNRRPCMGTSEKGKPCGEQAINLDKGMDFCWYHTKRRPELLKKLKGILEGSLLLTDHMLESGADVRGETTPPAPVTFTHNPYATAPPSVPPAQVPPRTTVSNNQQPMAFGDVARFVKASVNCTIEVRLNHRIFGESRIIGKVNKPADKNERGGAVMNVSHIFCNKCRSWQESTEAIRIPNTDFSYYSAQKSTIPKPEEISGPCDCDDIGSDAASEDYEPPADESDDFESLRRGAAMDDDDLDCNIPSPEIPPGPMRADSFLRMYIYNDRPPSVHKAAWSKLAPATRKNHIRILNWLTLMPPELHRCHISFAVIEYTLRRAKERKWGWSTISSFLSSLASALADLPLYTREKEGIDLRANKYFHAVSLLAQKKARIGALRPRKSSPLSYENFLVLSEKLANKHSWALLKFSWYLAARIGDARRLEPKNVKFEMKPDELGYCLLTAMFTKGKGAAFWGPYAIHAKVPEDIAKPLNEYLMSRINESPAQVSLFDEADQRQVSIAIAEFPDHSVRSIRRGSLVYYASLGAVDSNLKLLSGHKSNDTLSRYLDWGHKSSEAVNAAKERARLETVHISGAGNNNGQVRPTRMGYYSGKNGVKGKRTTIPTLFPSKTPSAKDLGIEVESALKKAERSDWPLHAHEMTPCDTEAILADIKDPFLKEQLTKALSFTTTPQHYGVNWSPLSPKQVPCSYLKESQTRRLLDVVKILPLPPGTQIHSAVKTILVEQEDKRRIRPCFEPQYNKLIDLLQRPIVMYPPRLLRRKALSSKRYLMQFDFKAWFDQIVLDMKVMPWHVLRTRIPVEWQGIMHSLFMLTKVPMGASHSAHLAQTITWAILEPIILMDVEVGTMIDNVAIASDDPNVFVAAVQTFVKRCKMFNATLNDVELIPSDPVEILRLGEQNAKLGSIFLGEEYIDGKVRNTSKNVNKLAASLERLQSSISDPNITVTRRNIAAFIGLATWMAHTTQIPLSHHFDLLRIFSTVESQQGHWDTPTKVTPAMLNAFCKISGPLIENLPVSPRPPSSPSFRNSDYDATIIVDASSTGYGAIISINGEIFELRGGWQGEIRHSAWSEPIGALEALRWTRKRLGRHARIAIVTDHIALAHAQRRPGSGNGGFSTAYHLNNFYAELYKDILDDADIFYVEGHLNPSDSLSRSNRIGDPQSFSKSDMTFPSLAEFFHPYMEIPQRPWWNV